MVVSSGSRERSLEGLLGLWGSCLFILLYCHGWAGNLDLTLGPVSSLLFHVVIRCDEQLSSQGGGIETGHPGQDPREQGLRGQKGQGLVLWAPLLTSCVTLDKFLNLSEFCKMRVT